MVMTFGDRLKKARVESGFTQAELAAKVGAYQTKYQNWESGVYEPDIETIARLSGVLGVSLDWLFGKDDSTTPYPKEFEKEIHLFCEDVKPYGSNGIKRIRKMLPLIFEESKQKKRKT